MKAILNLHGFRREMTIPELLPEIYIPFTEPLGIASMIVDHIEDPQMAMHEPLLKNLVFSLIDQSIDPFDGTKIAYYDFIKLV
jgi:hypothetical protein